MFGHRWNRWDFAFTGAVLLLLVWQLFIPPALSVANDHDFEKILGHICYAPVETTQTPFFDYAVLHYAYDGDSCIDWPMRTTNEAAFAAGWWLNSTFHSQIDFDLRYMGIVYGLIFFAGFLTMQRALRRVPAKLSMIAQAAWIAVFCNAVYVPMFNTLYFDALSLATLTGALAAAAVTVLDRGARWYWFATAALWLALLAGSKGQHAPLALLCIPALWIAPRRFLAIRALGTVAIVACAWVSLTTMPRFYQGEATFNALFYRILPTLPEPRSYLAETKIPISWARYSGEVAFAEDVPLRDPDYEERFGEWFGPVQLIRLYFRHPSAAWIIARENLDEASMDRVRIRMAGVPHRLSNYEESQGKPPQAISHFFTVWPALKNAVFGARPLLYAFWIIAVIAAAWILAPRDPNLYLLLAIITTALAAEFAICMLDGADGGRHLTLFNALLDFLVCGDAVLAARRFLKPAATSDTGRSPS
ncbi:MAG TPA: hypothetical protein VHC90_23215 [Bryobacteraceae bacterium]|nr:hypothetical protein [Bryobacteraceae bacterium]